MTKTWLITGAGRGMGVEFARAALAAGHNVVATGRDPDTVRAAVGAHENLLVTALDVTPESTTFAELSIDGYDEARTRSNAFWSSMNGTQAGDPAKLARGLVQLVDSAEPPLRWAAGEDVVEGVEDKARLLLAQVDAHRELSTSLAHEDAKAAA